MDGVAGAGTGAAPAAAPGGGTAPASAPSGGTPAAAPAKQPILFRPPESDRDYDVSDVVEKAIREHRRKVVVDGQEREFDLETAFRAAAREPASEARFQEAARFRAEASRERARIEAANAGMSDPTRAPVVLRKRMGDQKYEEMVIREAKEILALDEMTPAQRQELAQRRKRDADLEDRTQKVYAQEHTQKQAADEAAKRKQAETKKRVEREWPPLVKSHGVPEGFVADVMRAALKDIRESKALGITLTEPEALRRASVELKKKIGVAAAPPPPPPVETIQAQPGRETSPAAAPPRRAENGTFKKKGPLRPQEVLDRIKSVR